MSIKLVKLARDEYIVKIVRRHWFILFEKTFGLVVVLLLPFGIFFLLSAGFGNFFVDTTTFNLNVNLIIFLSSAWLLIIMLRFFSYWTDIYLDGWIITNKRIVDIEQKGFFKRQTSNFRIEHIQDITTETNGFIPTILNFGDMHVQTAGMHQKFIIHSTPNPRKIKEIILTLHNKEHADDSK